MLRAFLGRLIYCPSVVHREGVGHNVSMSEYPSFRRIPLHAHVLVESASRGGGWGVVLKLLDFSLYHCLVIHLEHLIAKSNGSFSRSSLDF